MFRATSARIILAGLSILLAGKYAGLIPTAAAAGSFPDPVIDIERSSTKVKQAAVFAGGCFWCTEAVFEQIKGVDKVISGYAGGDRKSAHYDIVSAGRTEHAESIQITFDPTQISYGTLLKIFFSVAHDPTQLNRQGPDHGRQYRSAIFFVGPDQKRVAEAYIQQLEQAHVFGKPIVTQVSELKGFYPAEEYHQDFVKRNPNHPYVIANAIAKIQKTRKEFSGLLKKGL